MKGQEILNLVRRTDKHSGSSTELVANTKILKQQKQLNGRNHHIPVNTNTEFGVLNSPIKRHYLANWTKKEDLTICCLQETHLIDRKKHLLRVKGWKIYQANCPPKTGRSSNTYIKVDFKPTLVKRDKEGHFILINGAIHQEEITIINLYAHNVSAPNFIKHT
jgi:hypothetical protein